MKQLSSRHHPLVAACKALARGRGGDDRLLLDGAHLVGDAARAGVQLHTLALTTAAIGSAEGQMLAGLAEAQGADVVQVSDAMMESMSPVASPSGVIAIAARPRRSLDDVFHDSPQLAVVAVDVQDAGNAGAIVRSAEACGATGVAFCGTSADPYGWKALRGAMGSTFRLRVASAAALDEVSTAAQSRGVKMAAAVPRGGSDPRCCDLRGPVAFVLGGEGPGLAPAVVESADLVVSLPMREPVESLNVAVAAALLVYEATSQREGRR